MKKTHNTSTNFSLRVPQNIYEAMLKFMELYGTEIFGDRASHGDKWNMSKLIITGFVRFMDWHCAEGTSRNKFPDGLGQLIGDDVDYTEFTHD